MKISSTLILGPIVLGLSVLAWLQHSELSELRARQNEQSGAGEHVLKKLAGAEANVRELEQQLKEAKRPLAPGKTGSGAPTGSPQSMESAMGALMPGLANLMDRPGMQRMMSLQQRSLVERRFSALFEQMKLPAEQAEKLKALLVDRELVAMDTAMAAAQNGLNPMQNAEELKGLISAGQAESDEQIKQLLGASGYQQYLDYRVLEPQRATVAQLQQNLGYTDAPLTRTQATQLTELLYNSNSGGRGAPISDEVIGASKAFLSPVQVDGLSSLKKQQEAAAALRATFPPGMPFPGPGTKG